MERLQSTVVDLEKILNCLCTYLMVTPYIFQVLSNVWIQFKSYQFCVESAEETCNISHTVICRKGESAPVAFSIKRCVTPLLFLGWPIVLSFLTLLEKKFSAASYSNSCVWSLKS